MIFLQSNSYILINRYLIQVYAFIVKVILFVNFLSDDELLNLNKT